MKKIILVGIVTLMMTGCSFGGNEKPVTVDPPTDDEIHAAMEKKLPQWSREMVIEDGDVVGNYASGVFTDPEGQGPNFWFAVKENGEWSVVAYGNYGPYCDEVDPYGVPYELVKLCLDRETKEAVKRTKFTFNKEI